MANSKGRSSASYKAYYARYDSVAARRRRLERHLKRQPNDEQAKSALSNLKHRGPRPGTEGGWMQRGSANLGFYDSKKGPKLDTVNPKTLAWMQRIIRKAEAQHQHDLNYKSKEERAKGGKVK